MGVLQRAYFQGHTYLLLDNPTGTKWWNDAEAEAVGLGGHLATIGSAAEDGFVFSTFASTVQSTAASLGQNTTRTWLFIGLNDQATEGTSVWSSGAALGYTHFLPNDQAVFADQDFVAIDIGVNFSAPGLTFTPGGWHTLISNASLFDVPYSVAELPLLKGTNGADTLTAGTSGADLLQGLGGSDILNGLGGGDTMQGGPGSDTYVVDNPFDKTIELLNQGLDTVKSTVTRALGAHLENLTLLGTKAINGAGNALPNTIVGNNARNVLNGAAGNDKLDGGKGNDLVNGGAGNDRVDGGLGLDVLAGAAGADTFVFSTKLGATNVDRISDFNPVADTFLLVNFDGVNFTHKATAAEFFVGTKAHDANDRIIYDKVHGVVYFDEDGLIGPPRPSAPIRLDGCRGLARADGRRVAHSGYSRGKTARVDVRPRTDNPNSD